MESIDAQAGRGAQSAARVAADRSVAASQSRPVVRLELRLELGARQPVARPFEREIAGLAARVRCDDARCQRVLLAECRIGDGDARLVLDLNRVDAFQLQREVLLRNQRLQLVHALVPVRIRHLLADDQQLARLGRVEVAE